MKATTFIQALGSLAVIATAVAVRPAIAGPTECIVGSVPAPFVLPDGVERPAGSLKICVTRELSPVAAMHRLSVDGMPIAFAQSRTGRSEVEPPAEPYMLFRRDRGAVLSLVGYGWPDGSAARTYLFSSSRQDGTMTADPLPEGAPTPSVVMVAAYENRP